MTGKSLPSLTTDVPDLAAKSMPDKNRATGKTPFWPGGNSRDRNSNVHRPLDRKIRVPNTLGDGPKTPGIPG
jgi:hypothetical protein